MGELTAERCQECEKAYESIWQAPDDLWTKIVGVANGSGLFCLQCFDDAARERGIYLYWECAGKEYPAHISSAKDLVDDWHRLEAENRRLREAFDAGLTVHLIEAQKEMD